jgi:hypothetical protein
VRHATLRRRSLAHFWRTNAAVVLGVATAVAVLAGSLLVGESVRASLARLALARLGAATHAVESAGFVREDLAQALAAAGGASRTTAPILALPGVVSQPESGRQATGVLVYGVDERFFAFHGVATPPGLEGRGALLSESLALELQAGEAEALIVKLSAAPEIPASTLFGRRDEPGRRMRVTMRGVVPRSQQGEFSLRPRQQEVRAVFLPLAALQRALDLGGRVNTLLVSEPEPGSAGGPEDDVERALIAAVGLEDLGLRVRLLPERRELALESESALLDDELVALARKTAQEHGLVAHSVFVYLANTLRAKGREVPYSLVAGLDEAGLRRLPGSVTVAGDEEAPPLVLNEWAASDLGARKGDRVTMEYYLWHEEGRLTTESSVFTVAGLVPLEGAAADRDLVPPYPGITESLHLSDWDPPFPIDLGRVRPKDEAYWDRWRTTPKAFVSLEVARRLWGHRLGRVTSLRLVPAAGTDLEAARAAFVPGLLGSLLGREGALSVRGLVVSAVRARALAAARGTTDFGEYFVYFSSFLVVAALLLAGLFFRLGVEQRLREVGLLRALGFTPGRLRRQFLGEGLALAALGCLLGVAGAAAYAGAVVQALRTVWVGAVGTRELALSLAAAPLLAGAAGGGAAALGAIAWTLRGLLLRSPRALLAGSLEEWTPRGERGRPRVALVCLAGAAGLLAGALGGVVGQAAAFFGAGGLLLLAALLLIRRRLRSRPAEAAALRGVLGLGLRAATFRPGRSLLCIALVAAAAFVIVSVGAFRREGGGGTGRDSESGGFALLATSLQPLHHDPATKEGRAALGLPEEALEGIEIARFRVSAGEDLSCLNLYRPSRPTVLGAASAFLRQGRFAFQSSLAQTPEERANPWRILEREDPAGVLNVAVDANSLAYVLHRRLGEEMVLADTAVRVRFAAALRPGLLRSELVSGEAAFLRAFPGEAGYRFFLIDVPAGRQEAVSVALERHLSDYGFDASATASRLAAFHRVESTYIGAFQTLGVLGLLLGTLGLGTVLLRNALERRSELALLQAVGFNRGHVRLAVLAENALLLGLGLAAGVATAFLAIAPALLERGGGAPLRALVVLLLAVALTGLLVSSFAVALIARLPLLGSLRSE